jgi:hypothetical protein
MSRPRAHILRIRSPLRAGPLVLAATPTSKAHS